MMMLVKTMPDGDGEDVEDDAASIFTMVLYLTTLHRCCSNSGYVCIKGAFKGTLHMNINFLIERYLHLTRVTMNSCTKRLNIEHHLTIRALPSTGNFLACID